MDFVNNFKCSCHPGFLGPLCDVTGTSASPPHVREVGNVVQRVMRMCVSKPFGP